MNNNENIEMSNDLKKLAKMEKNERENYDSQLANQPTKPNQSNRNNRNNAIQSNSNTKIQYYYIWSKTKAPDHKHT